MQMRSPVGTYFRPAADTKGPRERLANPARVMCHPLGLRDDVAKLLAYANGNGCAARWAENQGCSLASLIGSF